MYLKNDVVAHLYKQHMVKVQIIILNTGNKYNTKYL